jgi:hypothetical protein
MGGRKQDGRAQARWAGARPAPASRLTFYVSRFTFHVLRFTFYVSRFTFYASLCSAFNRIYPPIGCVLMLKVTLGPAIFSIPSRTALLGLP